AARSAAAAPMDLTVPTDPTTTLPPEAATTEPPADPAPLPPPPADRAPASPAPQARGGLPVAAAGYDLPEPAPSTPAIGSFPGSDERSILVHVWYLAVRSGAPYPLVVFAHGFGASPESYTSLLAGIASGGYVVAAPLYPILSGWPDGP